MRLAGCFLLWFVWGALGVEAQQQPPSPVVTVNVAQREVAAGQTFVGQLQPSRRSIVGSAVDGRVVELLVDDGDPVGMESAEDASRAVGQPMVQLLTDTISIEIDAARASAELRQQELAELEAGTRPEELTQALARLEGAEALMEFTQLQLNRVQALFDRSQVVTKEQLDEALSNAITARKNQIAAKAAHELAVAGPRKEQIAQAKARLAVAGEEVRRLEDQRNKYTIRAPFPGHVVAKVTEVGAWLSRGDPVMEVVALDPIEVDISVPEAAIAYVTPGAPVQVQVDAIRDQVFTGVVDRIIPQADYRARTFPVKVRLDNPRDEAGSHLLKAGMLARATLAVGQQQQALLVPKDAIVLGGPTPTVMMVQADPQSKQSIAAAVPVQLGVAVEGLIQVIGELQPGQPVIVIGNERVRPGQPVAPSQRPTAEK
jgi:RND family efflux transporter MFP subunit